MSSEFYIAANSAKKKANQAVEKQLKPIQHQLRLILWVVALNLAFTLAILWKVLS